MANPIDYIAIQNVLSRYCIALDTKDLSSLIEVFMPDVDAQYPFPGGDMQGIDAVKATISKRLHHITSQHALTTQHIEIDASGETAHATTYFSGVHFGKAPQWEGVTCTAYGKYIDEFVKLPPPEDEDRVLLGEFLHGSSGIWKIQRRRVEFMARVGEEGIFMRD